MGFLGRFRVSFALKLACDLPFLHAQLYAQLCAQTQKNQNAQPDPGGSFSTVSLALLGMIVVGILYSRPYVEPR